MDDNKNSLGTKIQKNPALLVLLIVVIGVAIFALSALTTAIKDKVAEMENTTVEETTETTTQVIAEPDNLIKIDGLKKYSETIVSVTAENEGNGVSVFVEFSDKEALLENHFAKNLGDFNIVPMFCFYVGNGVQVKCPGTFAILEDEKTAKYTLTEIGDYANAVGLTDEITVTVDNVLLNGFNLYVEHISKDGVGKTICGSYAQTVEQFNKDHGTNPPEILEKIDGIKKVETTVCDEFVWVDIYFEDAQSYTDLHLSSEDNIYSFGFEKGGKNFKRDFHITEYDSTTNKVPLNMIRCKFDAYDIKGLAKDIDEKDITVAQLFTDYSISVWMSDYDSALFSVNNTTNVMENLEAEATAEETTLEGEETTLEETSVVETTLQ